MNQHIKKEWTVMLLWEALQKDLQQCHTPTERTCCEAIGKKEIRAFAADDTNRKNLTQAEIAIVRGCGL